MSTNNQITKTGNVLDNQKGDIISPEKRDYMRTKDLATQITASGHLHAVIEQYQGERVANTSL